MFSEVPADLELKTMKVYVYEGWISKDNLYGFIHGQPELDVIRPTDWCLNTVIMHFYFMQIV